MTEQLNIVNFLFPDYGQTVVETLGLYIVITGAAGMFGLVKVRLGDRRWLAVYILSLTGAGLAIFLWGMMTRMSFDGSENWQLSYWIRLGFITLAGLLGTGVSLC